MKKIIISTLVLISVVGLYANNLFTVTNPTAGILSRGEARIHLKNYKNNGLAFGADVGLLDNLHFGLGYGAEHMVGDQKPRWRGLPDANVRFRIINETLEFPAIAIGVDINGHGTYNKVHRRYDIKSKGAYLVGSKNFTFLGLMGFDFGANYTFEQINYDKKFDIFTGMYKTIGDDVIVFADYSFGLNDYEKGNPTGLTGRGRGYLNTAVQLRLSDNLSIKFLMHDMLLNREETKMFDRALILDYRWFF